MAICTVIQASLAVLLVVACHSGTATGAKINIINQCGYPITAYRLQGSSSDKQGFFLKQDGGTVTVDVGQTSTNTIWASTENNANQNQASNMEITVNGAGGQDFYDISLVNAYNIPTKIEAVGKPVSRCGAPSCIIAGLSDFCQTPNQYVSDGKAEYCINPTGTGLQPTDGNAAFKASCPDAKTFNGDFANTVRTCNTGGDYNFLYCP